MIILKVKELKYQSLILKIDDGVYYIEIQETKVLTTLDRYYPCTEIQTLESYESCDYTVEEVCDKLDKIYTILKS